MRREAAIRGEGEKTLSLICMASRKKSGHREILRDWQEKDKGICGVKLNHPLGATYLALVSGRGACI